MPASPLDSAIYGALFGDNKVAALFSDQAEIRAMLKVEGALALAQGKLGLIPKSSAKAIHSASQSLQIDPQVLAADTGRNAVVVPALVAAFRNQMDAPGDAQYVHWGATSQDIIDTALIVRLRALLDILEPRLIALTKALGRLAGQHATLAMAGRTWGQTATITSFGAVLAGWGQPMLRHLDRLAELRPRLLCISLSGAAGTLSVMGADGPALRAELARSLDLNDTPTSWHTARDNIGELAGWLTLLSSGLGKIGEDVGLLAQSCVAEISLNAGGASSTMPQKSNPVPASLLVALARQNVALNSVVQGALIYRQQRDGAAWMGEWLSLPQICAIAARGLTAASQMLTDLAPNARVMAAGIDDGRGLIYAEALSFALARHMPRPEAQAAIKALCAQVVAENGALVDAACEKWPDANLTEICTPGAQLGTAPQQARQFATTAAAL